MILVLISYIFNIFGILGAIEGTRKQVRIGRMNFFFLLNNLFSILYFLWGQEYGYVAQSAVFFLISLWGIRNGIKYSRWLKQKENEKQNE